MITDLQKQKAIFHHLQAFGIRHHCAGHRYLCTSITLALAHPEYLSEVMEQFYPAVAKKHQRSIGAVESAMRRAIIDAYESGVWQATDSFSILSALPRRSPVFQNLSLYWLPTFGIALPS